MGVEKMDTIIKYMQNYETFIVIILVILVLVLLFFEILNKVEIDRLQKRYRKLMKGSSGKNIEEMLIDYNERVEKTTDNLKEIQNLCNTVETQIQGCVQKCAMVRYRAFEDVGSDLSYSIALLNNKNNGFILTGIYGRNESTTFAKPIENGISKYDLSDEEKSVLKEALSK